ncbi:CPXCG motif-containing cysteine-rich protein [Aliikangiella sp. IMCC44632]
MNLLDQSITCPYCWQEIDVLIDTSVTYQEYIEDCQVCCRPIVFQVVADPEQAPQVVVKSEDD